MAWARELQAFVAFWFWFSLIDMRFGAWFWPGYSWDMEIISNVLIP